VFSLQEQASLGFDAGAVLKNMLLQRTRAYDFYGKVMAAYVVCSIVSIYYGFKNLASARGNDKYRIQIDLMSYLLPFVSFMIDASVNRVYSRQARSLYQFVKIVLAFYFLIIYVVALNRTPKSAMFYLASGNMLVFPFIITAYWYLLVRGRL
jgi:hypothetical protein